MHHLPRRLVAAACLSWLLVPRMASAQFGATPTDGVTLPETSITNRDDALAIELNPAGLAFIQGFDAQVVAATRNEDDGLLSGGGLYLGGSLFGTVGLGGSVQWVDNALLGEFKKFSLASALGLGSRLAVGLAFNYFDSDVDGAVDTFSSWDTGLQLRLADFLAVSGTVRDFNTPRLGGQPLEPRYSVGSAFRFDEGRYLAELEGIYEDGLDEWFLRGRVSAEPLDGLRLFVEAQSDQLSDFDILTGRAGLTFSLGPTAVTTALVAEFGDFGLVGTSTGLRAASRPIRTVLEPRGFLAGLTLRGSLSERGTSNIFIRQPGFLDLLLYLDRLARDDHATGIVLTLENVSLSLGQHWELRQALQRLKDRGKSVYVYLSTSDFGDVYLASVADRVYAHPGHTYFPRGLSNHLTYLGELFDNIEVLPEFVRIAEYKAAAETIVGYEPSEATLEATNGYYDDVYGNMLAAIADGRDLSVAFVREVIDSSPHAPEAAQAAGMIDGVCFPDELERTLGEDLGRRQRIVQGYDPNRWRDYRWVDPPSIAIVYVDGDIIAGRSGAVPFVGITSGHITLSEVLDRLSRERRVRAIVLRVDSPGGSAWASENIWRAVDRADERVPVVVSMGGVAASGGYYVASGGREIFATELTLTGSIGIFAGHFAARELFGVLGINRVPILRGANANLFGIDEPWTEAQRNAVFRDISLSYDIFLERVAEGRDGDPADIDPIARGRIWSGQRAVELGLVDATGSLLDAIDRAKELGGMRAEDEVTIETYPEGGVLSLLSLMMARAEATGVTTPVDESLAEMAGEVLGLLPMLRYALLYGDGRPVARLPFEVGASEGW